MTTVPAPGPNTRTRPPFWRDIRVVRAALQVLFALGVAGLLWFLYRNLIDNLEAIGIETSFDYLDQPAGFSIAGSSFRSSQTVSDALRVGIKNTFLVAIVGIILATVMGVLIGIARLSENWLVRKAAALYVETIRNIPPLLVIFVAFFAMVLQFPRIQDAATLGDYAVISVKGVAIVSFVAEDNFGAYLAVLAVAIVVSAVTVILRTVRSTRTGEPHHRVLWGLGTFLVISVGGFFLLGRPISLSKPVVEGVQVVGGLDMIAAYVALTLALSVYTASHIAEIVRGSIQAVPKGQSEAAMAIALSSFQRLRYVVLPQAFRIAVPPIINQYLNLTKNSSLGLAIGFAEITQVTRIVIGNGNPAPQSIVVLMGIYLSFSLVISGLANLVNRRLQLVER